MAIAALEYTADRISAAKAADELLNISNISCSFVLYPDGDRVLISARSIGDINVQGILEPLGGGGNGAAAGAQVPGGSITDTLKRLVASIDQYFEN
ncbi:MAG: DHHA1 domain-containing protein [Eubacteriales bacterium]